MNRLILIAVIFTSLFCVSVLNIHAEEVVQDIFLPVGSVDSKKLIGPPPEVGSEEFGKQMFTVLWLQRTRTPSQVEFVREKLNFKRFEPLLEGQVNTVNISELRKLLASIINEVRGDYDRLKAEYDYPRPFVANEAVKPATNSRPVGSYPSGHATRSVVYARILGEIFPDKKDELMQLALQIGYGRVIAGVHYPMDVLAGQRLGNAYSDVILANPEFKQKLHTVKHK